MLWYANEPDIQGIVPDRWDARGLGACQLAVAAYEYHIEMNAYAKSTIEAKRPEMYQLLPDKLKNVYRN